MIRRHISMTLTPAEQKEVGDRQLASRVVTKHGRECECDWCSSAPRRDGRMLVTDPGKKLGVSEIRWLN